MTPSPAPDREPPPEKSGEQPPEQPHRPVIRFLLTHLLYGSLGAAVFCAGILYFDTGGIGSLIARSSEPWLWQALLFFGNWITFGSVAMAIAIMRLGEETDDDPGRNVDED